MSISLYAATFNTKFNIQTQKATWTTQNPALCFPACSLNVTSLDHPEPLVFVDFLSWVFIAQLSFLNFFLKFFPPATRFRFF